jgi:aspartyl/asparaginyl-tRNA synthetase
MTHPATLLHSPSSIWRAHKDHHLQALRNPWYRTLAVLQNTITEATVAFWQARGAQTLYLPVTTGAISSPMGLGSDSKPVAIDLFGERTYLADSMQFMLEYGLRLTGGNCYYIMPSFRGEETDSSHLAQFFHSEAEIYGSLADVEAVVEEYLVALAQALLVRNANEIALAGGRLAALEALSERPAFTKIPFSAAAGLIDPDGVWDAGAWRTLTRAGERQLMDRLGEFVWVEEWDHLSVPFYQAFADSQRTRAKNADLLFGVGEVVGAGERHLTSADVRAALAIHQVDSEPYDWYCSMRDLEPVQTAGFGLGIERFLMWVLDHDEIRDLQLVPRENGRLIVP